MGKLGCICGNVISDVRYPSPTEGSLIRQQDQDELQNTVSQSIASYFAALSSDRKQAWLTEFFLPGYPIEIDDASVVADIIARYELSRVMSVCECDKCGRLWVEETPGANKYRSFIPDQTGYSAVLRSCDEPAA